jgi:hypothetical protein
MKRVVGFAVVAAAGVILARMVMGLFGLIFSLLSGVLWIGLILAVLYLILKVVSPETAERIRSVISRETGQDAEVEVEVDAEVETETEEEDS